ncbi:MAG: subclass B1 metallo-beta-lactamase [Cyclobacteriaceae bacterium]
MRAFKPLAVVFLIGLMGCSSQTDLYKSESLEISKLTEHAFIHRSFLETESYGKVSCNGLIYIKGGEAIVFDTPVTESASIELIDWVQSTYNCEIKSVVATHFHEDCTGGLDAFSQYDIVSFARELTIQLARDSGNKIPEIGFDQRLVTTTGGDTIYSEFLGDGHTRDNIVAFIPSEGVLFGGCLIKTLDAGEGYTGDANLEEWSNTVRSIKRRFKNIKQVVPGHGKSGGSDLLDYTIDLFSKYEKD